MAEMDDFITDFAPAIYSCCQHCGYCDYEHAGRCPQGCNDDDD